MKYITQVLVCLALAGCNLKMPEKIKKVCYNVDLCPIYHTGAIGYCIYSRYADNRTEREWSFLTRDALIDFWNRNEKALLPLCRPEGLGSEHLAGD